MRPPPGRSEPSAAASAFKPKKICTSQTAESVTSAATIPPSRLRWKLSAPCAARSELLTVSQGSAATSITEQTVIDQARRDYFELH